MSGVPAVPRISVEEAARLLAEEGYAYLDVRTEQEFALGHPSGAYNVPSALAAEHGQTQNEAFLGVVCAVFPSEAKLVVGCHTGNRSQRASLQLMAAGFQVVELRAGYAGSRDPFGRTLESGWRASGFPTSTEALEGHDYASLLARVAR